uniref:Uncharacterized protein n=1 Tax=Trichogramma kaykai TaxID=54128 RepID=A0ABD2WUS5_9HYME
MLDGQRDRQAPTPVDRNLNQEPNEEWFAAGDADEDRVPAGCSAPVPHRCCDRELRRKVETNRRTYERSCRLHRWQRQPTPGGDQVHPEPGPGRLGPQ